MEDKSKNSFVFYKEWGDLILNLPVDKKAELIDSMINFAFKEKDCTLSDSVSQAILTMIKEKIKEDKIKYQEVVKKRKEAASRKKQNSETTTEQMQANASKC